MELWLMAYHRLTRELERARESLEVAGEKIWSYLDNLITNLWTDRAIP